MLDVVAWKESAVFAALAAAFAVFLAVVGILVVAAWLGSVTDPQRIPPPEAVPFLGGHPP